MNKQQFEQHINEIISASEAIGQCRVQKFALPQDVLASHFSSIELHRNKLNEFYNRHTEEEEPETLIYLQNKKDDIEFHLHWQCDPGSFEYQSYEEELQDVQRKIDELTKENGDD